MEMMEILSTNPRDWPEIRKLILNTKAEVEKNKMDKDEWAITVTGTEGQLSALHDQLKEKTPKTICMESQNYFKLMFTTEDLDLIHKIGQTFKVDIRQGNLSENGWHITIEDEKEVLEKIQAFLKEKGVTASLF